MDVDAQAIALLLKHTGNTTTQRKFLYVNLSDVWETPLVSLSILLKLRSVAIKALNIIFFSIFLLFLVVPCISESGFCFLYCYHFSLINTLIFNNQKNTNIPTFNNQNSTNYFYFYYQLIPIFVISVTNI